MCMPFAHLLHSYMFSFWQIIHSYEYKRPAFCSFFFLSFFLTLALLHLFLCSLSFAPSHLLCLCLSVSVSQSKLFHCIYAMIIIFLLYFSHLLVIVLTGIFICFIFLYIKCVNIVLPWFVTAFLVRQQHLNQR